MDLTTTTTTTTPLITLQCGHQFNYLDLLKHLVKHKREIREARQFGSDDEEDEDEEEEDDEDEEDDEEEEQHALQ